MLGYIPPKGVTLLGEGGKGSGEPREIFNEPSVEISELEEALNAL